MPVVINPKETRLLRNWITFGQKSGANDLTVSWDDKSYVDASKTIKDEYGKLGGETNVSGICDLISGGNPSMFPFRAWIEVKLANYQST